MALERRPAPRVDYNWGVPDGHHLFHGSQVLHIPTRAPFGQPYLNSVLVG